MKHSSLQGGDLHAPSNEQVENNTGLTITAGTVVRFNGNGTTYPQIVAITTLNDEIRGVVQADILTGESGYITTLGRMDLDTSGLSVGNLYTTAAGALTDSPTSRPMGEILVAAVAGVIYVGPAGLKGADGGTTVDVHEEGSPVVVGSDTLDFQGAATLVTNPAANTALIDTQVVPNRQVRVAADGRAEHTTFAAGLAAINALSPVPSATDPSILYVHPGAYTEAGPFTIPAGCYVIGLGDVTVITTVGASPVFQMSNNSELRNINAAGGSAGARVALGSGESCTIVSCQFASNTIGVDFDPTHATAMCTYIVGALDNNGTGIRVTGGIFNLESIIILDTNTLDIDNTAQATIRMGSLWARTNFMNIHVDTDIPGMHNSEEPGDFSAHFIDPIVVGRHDRGARSSFGEGGPHTVGMVAKTNTNLAAGTWATITDSLITAGDANTASLFPGLTNNNAFYLGSDAPFPGFEVTLVTAMVAGVVTAEVSTGAGTWQAVAVMERDVAQPFAQQGDDIFRSANAKGILLGDTTGWASATYDGVAKYWVRFYITTGLTTGPVGDLARIGTNSTVLREDGHLTHIGAASPRRELPLAMGTTYGLIGAAPASRNVDVSTNIDVNVTGNGFNNGASDGFAGFVTIPEGLDTSQPIEFEALWFPEDGGSGDVDFEFYHSDVNVNDIMDGTNAETLIAQGEAAPGVAMQLVKTVFSFVGSELLPGGLLFFALTRPAGDPYAGNVTIASVRATGVFWK